MATIILGFPGWPILSVLLLPLPSFLSSDARIRFEMMMIMMMVMMVVVVMVVMMTIIMMMVVMMIMMMMIVSMIVIIMFMMIMMSKMIMTFSINKGQQRFNVTDQQSLA